MAEVANNYGGNGAGTSTLYLKINSNGKLFHKAGDTDKTIFLQRQAENPGYDGSDIGVAEIVSSQSGAKYYHKQYNCTEYGKISGIDISNAKFDTGEVPMLRIFIKAAEGNQECISLPVYNTKGTGLNQIVKGIITILPNIDLSVEYSVSTSKKEYVKDNGQKTYSISAFFNYMNGTERDFVKSAILYKSDKNPDGVIPSPAVVKKFGKEVWDFSEQDEYLNTVLEQQLERIAKELKASTAPSPKSNEKQSKPVAPKNVETVKGKELPIDDEMPF